MSPRFLLVTTIAGTAAASVLLAPAEAGTAQPRQGPDRTAHLALAAQDLIAPALSFSGRYVAYYAVPHDGSGAWRLMRTDRVNGDAAVVNRGVSGGVPAGHYSLPPSISGDGRLVAFTSDATTLVGGDDNGRYDAFVRDLPSGSTLLASAAADGSAANGDTGMASLAENGRYVVFTSAATDVVPGSLTTNTDVFRRDLATGTTVQVTVRGDGAPSRGPGSSSADVSSNGQVVAFNSFDRDLAPADGNDGEADLFVRFMGAGQTRWLSRDWPAGADPSGVVISPNGRWASSRWADGSLHLTRIASRATTEVAGDAYATSGAFSARLGRFVYVASGTPYVRDLAAGTDTAVTVPSGGTVGTVAISGDGRHLAMDWTPLDGGPSQVLVQTL